MSKWTSLPAGYLSNTGRTNAQMQIALEAWLQLTKKLMGAPQGSTLTINAGAIAIPEATSAIYAVANELGAATDDLDTITPHGDTEVGQIIILYQQVAGSTTTLVYGTGLHDITLEGNGNFDLEGATGSRKTVCLYWTGGTWRELFRCWGNDTAGYAAHIGAVSATSPSVTDLTTDKIDVTSTANDAIEVGAPGSDLHIGTGLINQVAGNLNMTAGGDVQVDGSRILTTADEGPGNALDADTLDGDHGSTFLQSPKYARLTYEVTHASAIWPTTNAWNNTFNWTHVYDPHGLVTAPSAPNIRIANTGTYRVFAYGHAVGGFAANYYALQMAVWNTGTAAYDLFGCPVMFTGGAYTTIFHEVEATVSGEISVNAGDDLYLRGFPWCSSAISSVGTSNSWNAITGQNRTLFSFELWWISETT